MALVHLGHSLTKEFIMKKRLVAGIALGGAALFAVPAGVAYAVSQANDPTPSVARSFGAHAAQGRANGGGNATDSAPRGNNQSGNGMTNNSRGGMQGGAHAQGAALDPAALVVPGSTLTAEETASLTFMIEEEKLAHDLYVELGDAWDLRIFVNIAGAETQHADDVRALLDAYGVDDPTAGMGTGDFANPTLQGLYDSLLAKGLTSSTDALEVGALVEETDIADLRQRESTNVAIDRVFGVLESGSNSHLRAFTKNLDRLGVTYDAQVLSSADVARILGQ